MSNKFASQEDIENSVLLTKKYNNKIEFFFYELPLEVQENLFIVKDSVNNKTVYLNGGQVDKIRRFGMGDNRTDIAIQTDDMIGDGVAYFAPNQKIGVQDIRINKTKGDKLIREFFEHSLTSTTNTRDETNNLKSLALMSVLVAITSNECIYGGRVNAKQVMEKVCEMASYLGIGSDGLRSLNRDISKGLEIFVPDIDFEELKKELKQKKKM